MRDTGAQVRVSHQRGRGVRPKQKSCQHTALNAEIVAIANSDNIWSLVSFVQQQLPNMNLVNKTTALHRITKRVEQDTFLQTDMVRHPVINALVLASYSELVTLDMNRHLPSTQSLSNLLWSTSILGVVDAPFLQMVLKLAIMHIERFKPLELATLLWAFAKIKSQYTHLAPCLNGAGALQLFEFASAHIQSSIEEFTFRNLVTAIGAYATVGVKDCQLFQAAAAHMIRVARTANAKELTKTAWAFGTVNIHSERLFHLVSKSAVRLIHTFEAHELANLLWGLASNDFYHAELYEKACNAAQQMDLNPQQLANILWALTRTRPQLQSTRTAVLALLPKCWQQVHSFKTQEFATAALSAAKAFSNIGGKLGREDRAIPAEITFFFEAAMPIMLPNISHFSDQSLANISTAYVAVRSPMALNLVFQVGNVLLHRSANLGASLLLQFIRAYQADFSQCVGADGFEEFRILVTETLFKQASTCCFTNEEKRSLAHLAKVSEASRVSHNRHNGDRAQQCRANDFRADPEGSDTDSVQTRSSTLQSSALSDHLEHPLLTEASPESNVVSEASITDSNRAITLPHDHEQRHMDKLPRAKTLSISLQPEEDQMIVVKNTFLQFAGTFDEVVLHNFQEEEVPNFFKEALLRTPLEFLKPRCSGDGAGDSALSCIDDFVKHQETVQAARISYQALHAVPALDCFPTYLDCSMSVGESDDESRRAGTGWKKTNSFLPLFWL